MTPFRRALRWSLAERYASLLIGIASVMVIARVLTPAEIGVFSLCAAFVAIAGTVRDFGVSEYIVQEKNLNRDRLRNVFGVALITAWSLGAFIFLIRGFLAAHFSNPAIESVMAIMALNFLVLPLASPTWALLNRDMAFRQMFYVQLACTVLQNATTIALAVLGHGPESLAWGSLAGILLQALAINLMRPWQAVLWPSLRGASQVFRYGAYQMSAQLLEAGTNNAHEFLIARSFGFSAVGLFSRAKGLVDMFQNNVTVGIVRVASVALAHASRDGEQLAPLFARGTTMFTGIAWPFFGALAIMAPEIIRVLFGPQWESANNIGTMLAVSILPAGLFALGPAVLTATGMVQRRLRVALIWCPVHLALLIAASQVSLEAMALCWFITNCVLAAAYATQLVKVLGVPLSTLYAGVSRSALVAACSTGVMALIEYLGASFEVPPLAVLPIAYALGALAWVVSLRIFQHPVSAEVDRLILSLRGRFSPNGAPQHK